MSEIEYFDFGFSPKETDYPLDSQQYRDSLINAFQEVFTKENSPYDEDWSYEDVDDFLEWTRQVDYAGILAVDAESEEVAGFAWGYRVDPQNKRIDPQEKFPAGLEDVQPKVFSGDTFMIDEVGVKPGYRRQGMATELEAGLLEKTDQWSDVNRVMQRTQWSGDNTGKLYLDGKMGFNAFLQEDNEPVTQEVEFVGKPGSDERIYLQQELEGEKPWK